MSRVKGVSVLNDRVEIISVPNRLMNNVYGGILERAEFARAERRLGLVESEDKDKELDESRSQEIVSHFKGVYQNNARNHIKWIKDPRFNESASRLYLQTLRTLQRINIDPASPLYGHGEEVFDAYCEVLFAGLKKIGCEILSPLPSF